MSRASKIQLLTGHSVHLSIPVIFTSSHNLHTTNDFSICSQIWNIYSFCQALDFAHISQPWRTIETRFKVSLYTYTLFYKLLFVFKIKTQFFIIGLLKWNATIQFFFVFFNKYTVQPIIVQTSSTLSSGNPRVAQISKWYKCQYNYTQDI